MSKQKNRHRRTNKDRYNDGFERDEVSEDINNISTNNHRAKSVVTTNVYRKNKISEKHFKEYSDDEQNKRNMKKAVSSHLPDTNQINRNRRHKNKKNRNKSKNSKLRDVRPEDLFQLKDPKKAKKLQNRKRRPKNFVPYSIIKATSCNCPICQKIIENMADTIQDKRTGQSAHFECVYSELSKTISLHDKQRLAYMGSGMFAIIEDTQEDGSQKFKIKEKLEYLK